MKPFFVSLLIAIAALPLGAVEVDKAKLPPPAARVVDFAKDIQPLFLIVILLLIVIGKQSARAVCQPHPVAPSGRD